MCGCPDSVRPSCGATHDSKNGQNPYLEEGPPPASEAMSSRLTTGATASAIVLATLVELGVPSQLGVSLAAARCPNDCSGKGYCDAGVCVCDPGWNGALDCSTPGCPSNCTSRGVCEAGVCQCAQGYTGADCSVPVCYNDCSCLLYTSPSPRDKRQSRMPSSA